MRSDRETFAPSPLLLPFPSLASVYLPIPKCHASRGINSDRPSITVNHSIMLHSDKFHLISPRAQNVSARCSTSPIRSGVSKPLTTFSCNVGWFERYRRAARRRKKLTRPRRPQTCASCTTVTIVARGKRCGGGMWAGHGACILCVYTKSRPTQKKNRNIPRVRAIVKENRIQYVPL
jgi:hypothetical protein